MRKDYYNKSSGYIMTWDEKRNMYVPKHQIVIMNKIGRRPRRGEIVHHINENKIDNRLSNLKLERNYQQHAKDHGDRWKGSKNPSKNMTQAHKLSLKKAWIQRKIKFGPTGAKDPNKLRAIGRYYGKKTPHK